MQIVFARSKKEISLFRQFRRKLYSKDPYYVSTAEFTFDMLLNKETSFAKEIDIYPVMALDDGEVLITALLIRDPRVDYLQISFFEALESIEAEVDDFMNHIKEFAKKSDLSKIIIGLNGHLSYGVGLSTDMHSPNTFDSTYSKLYYNKYFENYTKHELIAFSNTPSAVLPDLPNRDCGIRIRNIDLNRFEEEMESFREICNDTIGTTFLYSEAKKGHFYDLLKPMLFFLKPENILFAEDNGKIVGFLFWHPDYNEILKKGKYNSLISIALRYSLLKKRIRKVKLNSIGVKRECRGVVTIELLRRFGELVRDYETVETNFVWANNTRSVSLNKRILKNTERKFAVYELDI